MRRITAEQLQRAMEVLREGEPDIEERVHEVRKRFKETRALIRLFRGALADAFDIENRWYRDAGREIAAYRDASAVIEAVQGLDRATRSDIGRAAMRRLLRTARSRRDAQFGNGDDLQGRLANIVAQLPIGAARIHDAQLSGHGFDSIAAGLGRTFRDGRRAMTAAYHSGNDAAFHEWRKRVKDHWYHVQLLMPLWPEMMRIRAKALRDLSQLLGRHHDLTVVRAILSAEPGTFGGELEAVRIADVLRSKQSDLADKARPIGARIYAPTPAHFVSEIGALWEAWAAG